MTILTVTDMPRDGPARRERHAGPEVERRSGNGAGDWRAVITGKRGAAREEAYDRQQYQREPEKRWNTETLLEKALVGRHRGGRFAVQDDRAPVLDRIAWTDSLVLGSPIYFDNVTGEMHSFLERLFFPYLASTNPPSSLFGGERAMGFIDTMNAPSR